MAVKQYIGARYVPEFASPVEWAADTSYEALTIVTFNNASYTSKVQVPPTVGNPANNPQYWVLTGNYNAQVEQYRQETENYNAQAEQYRQETKNYNAQVEQYRQETENYNAQVEQHRQQTEKMLNTLTQGRTFLLVGDSLSHGYSESEGSTGHGWAAQARRDLNAKGGKCYTAADVSSTLPTGNCFGDGSWNNLLLEIHNNENIDDNTITDIVVFGGSNELNFDETTVRSGIDTFMNTAHQYFKRAKVRVGIIACVFGRFANELDVPSIYEDEVTACGEEYVNGTFYLFRLSSAYYLNSGGVHPTIAGYDYFYPMVLKFIISSSARFEYSKLDDVAIQTGENNVLNNAAIFWKVTEQGIFGKITESITSDKQLFGYVTINDITDNKKQIGFQHKTAIIPSKPLKDSLNIIQETGLEGYRITGVLWVTNVDEYNPSFGIYMTFHKIPEAENIPGWSGYITYNDNYVQFF